MHQVDAQPVVGQRVQVRLGVAAPVEGPAEILDLDHQPIGMARDRDVDGLAGAALVGVLDRVGAQLPDGQHQLGLDGPLHPEVPEGPTQPCAESGQILGVARHGETAGFPGNHARRPV